MVDLSFQNHTQLITIQSYPSTFCSLSCWRRIKGAILLWMLAAPRSLHWFSTPWICMTSSQTNSQKYPISRYCQPITPFSCSSIVALLFCKSVVRACQGAEDILNVPAAKYHTITVWAGWIQKISFSDWCGYGPTQKMALYSNCTSIHLFMIYLLLLGGKFHSKAFTV